MGELQVAARDPRYRQQYGPIYDVFVAGLFNDKVFPDAQRELAEIQSGKIAYRTARPDKKGRGGRNIHKIVDVGGSQDESGSAPLQHTAESGKHLQGEKRTALAETVRGDRTSLIAQESLCCRRSVISGAGGGTASAAGRARRRDCLPQGTACRAEERLFRSIWAARSKAKEAQLVHLLVRSFA